DDRPAIRQGGQIRRCGVVPIGPGFLDAVVWRVGRLIRAAASSRQSPAGNRLYTASVPYVVRHSLLPPQNLPGVETQRHDRVGGGCGFGKAVSCAEIQGSSLGIDDGRSPYTRPGWSHVVDADRVSLNYFGFGGYGVGLPNLASGFG